MQLHTHHVDAVNPPCKTAHECLAARHHPACRTFKIAHGNTFAVAIAEVEQHAVYTVVALEHSYGLLQGIGRQPVVAVHKANKSSRGLLQGNIPCMRLPAVLVEMKHYEALVATCKLLKNGP